MLQAGPEFLAWREGAAHSPPSPRTEPYVLLDRDGDRLRVRLNHPERHNALGAAMRDALAEALGLAAMDDSITAITLGAEGPSFSSGGDLGEFGSFPDPTAAHMIRLARSPARLLHTVAHRLTVELHGNCIGGGIELAAFAHRVVAAPDVRITLPEVSLGLIPGAGGTVSLPRRIGRQRTALLALSGCTIGAGEALAWGLVDAVAP
jgi:enoyl-CoA hydratase/carnithine racemase